MKKLLLLIVGSFTLLLLLTGCKVEIATEPNHSVPNTTPQASVPQTSTNSEISSMIGNTDDIAFGTQLQRGFINDNVLHSDGNGDIHYSSYIPDSYDGTTPYALFITLPGYEGLYFQGVGANMVEDLGTEAISYHEQMIVLSPQLDDWGETSANKTVALTEYFLSHYNIDPEKVYLEGYSGGGETGSLVMAMRPELYKAYLMVSSQWDGDLEALADSKTPVYMAIGEEDSYYGSEPLKEAYESLHSLYEQQGLSDAEIDRLLVLDVKEQAYFTERGVRDQHGGGGLFAHDEAIMGWLFGRHGGEMLTMETTYEVRNGTSVQTFAFPDDLPEAYNYGSGKISDWSSAGMNGRMPEPDGNSTVLNTKPDTSRVQVLYLWEEGNAPATTEFTVDMTGYFDSYDFRPYVTVIPVREGVAAKGAVVLMAGGAYQFRGDFSDTLPTAIHLRELGYQTFIVDYRLRPYTPQEGALDVARAVRFIRKNANAYGIEPDDIAVMGYSAGGIQAGEFLMHYDEDVIPTVLDASYVPDELDAVPAHASADGMIYSFYGRLSFGSTDVADLKTGNLPPTFYCYGTEDPFYRQFEAQVEVMKEVGVTTTTIVLDGWPHGFGGDGDWVENYAEWLETVFSQN